MVRTVINKLLVFLLCIGVLCPFCTVNAVAESHHYTVAEIEKLCGGIVDYKDGRSVQHFIDNGLCESAGISAEFYIIALRQQGNYDFSSYEKALLGYIDSHEIYSATTKEKYALALIAAGSSDSYIARAADEAIGEQGLMSLVFGLHLLNNGCKNKLYTAKGLVDAILDTRLSDGGWAVIGNKGDTDVTAMTLQALAPYYHARTDVKAAVDSALGLLSKKQQDNGGFISMGVENCESAAQVLTALSDLGIEQSKDGRFIKNGQTVLDAMLRYRNANGSFCHKMNGGANETATMQAFYAMTAYLRHCRGKGPLYVLDRQNTGQQEQGQKQKPTSKPQQSKPQTTPQTEPQTSPRQQSATREKERRQNDRSERDDGGEAQNGDRENERRESGTSAPQNGGETTGSDHEGLRRQPQQYQYYDNDRSDGVTRPRTEAPTEKHRKNAGNAEAPSENATESGTSAQAATTAATEGAAGSGAGLFQPTATAAAEVEKTQKPERGSYKPYAVAAIAAAAGIAVLVLFLMKKRNKKHYIAVGILAAAGVLFILLTNFESRESYSAVEEKTDAIGTVTLSVRCDTLSSEEMPAHIPKDGIILGETTFSIAEGDTVYDILIEAGKRYDFQVDNRGTADNAYIAGIRYLYEFDCGDLSGWMYRVDGEFPDVGCQSYTLHGGETIEWLYTKNIGKDL